MPTRGGMKMEKLLTKDELIRIRNNWKIENPELAVNEQVTINQLLDMVEVYKKALEYIADRENCWEDLPAVASKALGSP
jgi:ribosome-interacting GTPase 1